MDEPPHVFAHYKWMKSVIDAVARKFCYDEYDLPLLEPFELFSTNATSGIFADQSYHFIDRANRRLILRPELTHSLARMVSAVSQELPKPLRWYSSPKCYRYERPQKGRFREFRQINFDLLGANGLWFDLEILDLIIEIMRAFGVDKKSFCIEINHRGFLSALLLQKGFDKEEQQHFYKLVDKRKKLSDEVFWKESAKIFSEKKQRFLKNYLTLESPLEVFETCEVGKDFLEKHFEAKDFLDFYNHLVSLKKINSPFFEAVSFSPTTVRGLDYYTGLVFEVFSKEETIRRSLFGGGRYDDLTKLFSNEKIEGVGFGMGVSIFMSFLQVLGLLKPEKILEKDSYFVAALEDDYLIAAREVSRWIRQEKKVGVDFSASCVSVRKALKKAEQQKRRFVVLIGENEIAHKQFVIKDLKTGEEKTQLFDYKPLE